MGRTKRLRSRKKTHLSEKLDDSDISLSLTIWLMKNLWKNDTKLMLRLFPETGRGVASQMTMQRGDILISVPYKLMITYMTIETELLNKNPSLGCKLTIHELLTLFLITESKNKLSFWKNYIDSLPLELPVLPWLADESQVESYPSDLIIISRQKRAKFQESLKRVSESIKAFEDCVLDENLFKWGYVLVNTRSVYIDYNSIKSEYSYRNVLLDEPSMALCPFLDMFNHHFLANSEAQLVPNDDRLVYQLKTLVGYPSGEQIYISYGPHDNGKLMMEYGFFIPGNIFDIIKFEFQMVLETLDISLNPMQYKFLKCHNFIDDLFVGCNGVSFHLKALLYVGLNTDSKSYNAVIFGDTYPNDFDTIVSSLVVKLLQIKSKILQNEYEQFRNYLQSKDDSSMLVEDFLRYRISFVSDLINKFVI